MQNTVFSGGFADAPIDAARAFRVAMNVMARPGRIETLATAAPPAPLGPAAGTLILTLCDMDTGLYLAGAADTSDIRDWIAFYTGAPMVTADRAVFAIGTWADLQPLHAYSVGRSDYPDRACTLIAEVPKLEAAGAVLRGPGIETTAQLSVPDPDQLARNAALYPLGLDFFFTCGDVLAALPRSTQIGAEE
ncbi:phosphonate C-P lyase system protein PhnH [Thalassococcus sp. S3]|uniref:phosphonate C-P lyase system protein PhnH n=1 Tax=Thalassococcus sp. S3 TaxID=2017482 RepID=UPI00102437F6|nr:phosphonate C-P lyase system protein PhnH [Thalassococcus sp. S3]QBF30654.1 phosphonate C-P lyase system protein PhnH [Thalassococcus sp. S3]